MSIKSILSNVCFKVNVSVLILCLDDLFIAVSGVLKFPTIFGLLLIFPFMSVNICFMYLDGPMLGAYIFTIIIFSSWIYPLIIM